MDVKLFDFDLPEELIAQSPLKERTGSRLLTLNKESGDVRHRRFTDLEDELRAGDVLVLNDTKVIPARLHGIKETGANIELLLLKQREADRWEVLVKPGRRVKPGTRVRIGDGLLTAVCEEVTADGGRIVRFEYEGIFNEILDRLGEMPLPPYIKRQLDEPERYQTVYAKHRGSAAAPTAGLHFTEDFLTRLQEKGVELAYITLHVGLGTFRPVQAEHVEEHKMHAEYYRIDERNAQTLNRAREESRRIVAVGTTVVRTLETLGQSGGAIEAGSGWTDIFIYPGHTFAVVDAMITNFHLPKSTLIMLVSAFAGRDKVLRAYREAVKERYRFFSFGDAMFIY